MENSYRTHLETLFKLHYMVNESAHELREMYNKSKESIELLQGVSSEQILLHSLVKKLPSETRKIYEQSLEKPTEDQKLSEFFEFLNKRCQVLEAIGNDSKKYKHFKFNKEIAKSSATEKCLVQQCNEKCQNIFSCNKFRNLSVTERRDLVKKNSLCWLCLKQHNVNECTFKKMCPKCNKKHNGLLHFDESANFNRNTNQNKKAFVATMDDETVVCATANKKSSCNTLLATAVIKVKAANGLCITVRVLIDQGSMASFISERVVKFLDCEQIKTNINIVGIAGSVEPAKRIAKLQVLARYPSSFKADVSAIVLNKLTSMLPNYNFDRSLIKCDQIEELIMADPQFNKSSQIDMILGADVYSKIIMTGIIKPEDDSFVLQETEFGWIISGMIGDERKIPTDSLCMIAAVNELDETLRKFWEMEEVNEERLWSDEEKKCVEHFNSTIKKDEDGSYIVSLPFKENMTQLGDSRRMAMAYFFQLEKKFAKDNVLKTLYTSYINELIERATFESAMQTTIIKLLAIYHIIQSLRIALLQKCDRYLMRVEKHRMAWH